MIREGLINQHPAIWLENEVLKISVLPQKGADIFEFIHKPSRVDFLLKSPSGLKPPGEKPPADFLENYAGGWQELFPNPGDACDYRGETLPFHGEVALLPWDFQILQDRSDETSVRFWVDCRQTPFRLERTMCLYGNEPVLEIQGRVTNLSDSVAEFQWGHHIVLGGNFLEEGVQLVLPACRIITPGELYEPATAQLAPGQDEPWPFARGRKDAEKVDLRSIPGPRAHVHDDVYLTGLLFGHLTATNPRLRLCFNLDWDASQFGCIVNWRPLGGADLPPLTGIYGLGIEPWVSRFSLPQAIENGKALKLEPRQSLVTSLRVSVSLL
jgi:hypothetical protein